MGTDIITDAYRNALGHKLNHRLGDAILNGELKVGDLPEICDYILAVIDTITTKDQLFAFFDKLATSWPFFKTFRDEEVHQIQIGMDIENQFLQRAVKHQ